ncbi:hypothetical protein GCM10009007_00540 [Formosimonas limnophila]|uniref:Uncharacterized protein n=1 Tax=Formosimonas limnophila TaxID=1384487 RepID=A0A8J3CF38_9BURK|nr:hypothetical protein [Formosimonas limnophila]GHA64106.1 hypothetical protein GCM10009007_00540 [Formosimonas limnophila]
MNASKTLELVDHRCGGAVLGLFYAILLKAEEHLPIISAAQGRGMPVVAVFFDKPLSVCLARNAKRPEDEVVSEQALKMCFIATAGVAAPMVYELLSRFAGE